MTSQQKSLKKYRINKQIVNSFAKLYKLMKAGKDIDALPTNNTLKNQIKRLEWFVKNE